MKNLKIFGDSIIKGVTYNGQSYHLCQEHDFDTLRAQGVTVENNAKMGATIDAGLKQLDRKLGACDSDTTVLFCFGGNDCDYDWKAISEDPDGEHLPHTPSEQFIDRYCTAIRKAQSAGARVAMTSLPPLEQERYFTFITRGLSAENILHWLGDTDHLYRCAAEPCVWLQARRSARGVPQKPHFPTLIGADGIHPTQAGHDLIHHTVQSALAY